MRLKMSRVCSLTGKAVQVGHKVSHSNIKTKKRFKPNLHKVSLKSDILNIYFRLRVSSNALRTVEVNGGLDGYLLKVSNDKLPEKALFIKRKIKKSLAKAQEQTNS